MNHDFANAKRGAAISSAGKTRLTVHLDDSVVDHFRKVATENGRGIQTELNATLRAAMGKTEIRNVVCGVMQAPFRWMKPGSP